MAIWNDEWYDAVAVFSGSTTVVDGKPVIIYPGLCTKKHCPHGGHCPCSGFAGTTPTSTYGSTYNAAVPANLADPFLTNWTKPSYNPLVNGTGDDPSTGTAWKTASGEWRLIGNQQGGGSGAPIYGSKDFKTWYKIGFTTLKLGDCPTPGAPIRLHDAHAHPWCTGMGCACAHVVGPQRVRVSQTGKQRFRVQNGGSAHPVFYFCCCCCDPNMEFCVL